MHFVLSVSVAHVTRPKFVLHLLHDLIVDAGILRHERVSPGAVLRLGLAPSLDSRGVHEEGPVKDHQVVATETELVHLATGKSRSQVKSIGIACNFFSYFITV